MDLCSSIPARPTSTKPRSRFAVRLWIGSVLCLFLGPRLTLAVEITLPKVDRKLPIVVRADQANQWKQGVYDVWLLSGNVEIRQGNIRAEAKEGVLWIERAEPLTETASKIIAYLEKDVVLRFRGGDPKLGKAGIGRPTTLTDQSWFGRFYTFGQIRMQVTRPAELEPRNKPAVFLRGVEARRPGPWPQNRNIKQTQFEAVPDPNNQPQRPRATTSGQRRRIRVSPRYEGENPQIRWLSDEERNESVGIIDSAVNIVVDGIDQVGAVDLSADRIVVWTRKLDLGSLQSGNQLRDAPWEFYLEGNIVFRQADRVIYAKRMYYNVSSEYGVVLDAELLTPVKEYQGLIRLKADVLQQVDRQRIRAFGAALTSSRLAVPSYWFQSDQVAFSDQQKPVFDPGTGRQAMDERTGNPRVEHQFLATSRNNFVYVGGIPLLYWPVITTDLTKPTYYVDRVALRNDNVFGTHGSIDLDTYQIAGLPAIDGTKWLTSIDYLSERGFAGGSSFRYDREGIPLLGIPGRNRGEFDYWAIDEHGLDNLGADRRAVMPGEEIRGRARFWHRHDLPWDLRFTAELGYITDRNFLEQYYEQEWDELKDQTTGIELKKYWGNHTLSLTSDVRLNDFFTQTEWLPRLDHFAIGHSIFDRLTWYAHSHVGYARFRPARLPVGTEPAQSPLGTVSGSSWEVPAEGIRAASRQEVDLPFDLGWAKVVPYVMGEVAHWGEDLSGDAVTRLYGQAGIRASMPIWKSDPNVKSELFNLDGLAHKISLEAEYLVADANRDLSRFPLYDQLDDDATEHFRRRFFVPTNSFSGLPVSQTARYDERRYALRSGLQSWVSSPSTEIADDLTALRAGIHQRWQTRRGLPGQQRRVDWIVFDVDATLFPKASRDNFGEDVGLASYAFRWHLGDRLTLLSNGTADFFSDGLRTASLGGVISRPEQGQLYLGIHSLEGPVSSSVLVGSFSYRMSEKWIGSAATTVDFGQAGNIGQTVSLTRIGESAFIRVGFHLDESRDNVGIRLAIEPRFLPRGKLGRLGGVQLPPAGAYGIE